MTNKIAILNTIICIESVLPLFEKWIGTTEPRAILGEVRAYIESPEGGIDETILTRSLESALYAHVLAKGFVSSFGYPLDGVMKSFVIDIAEIAVAVRFITQCVVGKKPIDESIVMVLERLYKATRNINK